MESRTRGVACILASAFGFALMAFFVRLCDDFGPPVSSFQKSLFRNVIALAIACSAYFSRARGGGTPGSAGVRGLPARAWTLLAARSLAGLLGVFCNFYALSAIPIGEAMTLNKTAPFFTVLFSWMFLRERAGARRLVWLVAAFAGAVLVIKPGFRGGETFAALCALGGGLGAGVAYTCLRGLGRMKVESSFVILFFSAFSTVATVPIVLAGGVDAMTPAQTLAMVGAGCGAAAGQFGITAAYRFAAPRDVAVFDYSSVIFTALLGFAFFGQTPDAFSVAGFLLIVLAAARSR